MQPSAPAWATTQSAPAYIPQQTQYTPQPQVPSWADQTLPDPLAGLTAPSAAPYAAPAPYVAPYAAPAPYVAPAPAYQPEPEPYQPQPYQPQPYQPQPYQSEAQAAPYARTAAATTDPQADLWFLSNQPSAAVAADDEEETEVRSSSLMTAGLTVGFAILVIVLVLVFIQLMTSILR
jgi:hypothetical protein